MSIIKSLAFDKDGVLKTDLQFWVDRDGGGTFAQLTTLKNVTDALGGDTAIKGEESTSELLRKLLDENRLVVA